MITSGAIDLMPETLYSMSLGFSCSHLSCTRLCSLHAEARSSLDKGGNLQAAPGVAVSLPLVLSHRNCSTVSRKGMARKYRAILKNKEPVPSVPTLLVSERPESAIISS